MASSVARIPRIFTIIIVVIAMIKFSELASSVIYPWLTGSSTASSSMASSYTGAKFINGTVMDLGTNFTPVYNIPESKWDILALYSMCSSKKLNFTIYIYQLDPCR